MKKALRAFFADGGCAPEITLKYYSADVEASWTIDIESDESLQVVYQRKSIGVTYDPETKGPKENPDEDYWLYLSPRDAAVLGAILRGWAETHGERA